MTRKNKKNNKIKERSANNKATVPTKVSTVNLAQKIPVYIPDHVLAQIQHLCEEISTVEWSGVLFYSTEGDISKPKEFEITLEYIFPMDKGTGGATNYKLDDEDFIEFRMSHPESLKWTMGHIHSHNNMGVFFSGTDTSELEDNSEFHNYYLSVIVNNAGDIAAKVAFRGESENHVPYTCKGFDGKQWILKMKNEKSVMFVMDCEVYERVLEDVDDEFKEYVEGIIKKSRAGNFHGAYTPNHYYGYGYNKGKHPSGSNIKSYQEQLEEHKRKHFDIDEEEEDDSKKVYGKEFSKTSSDSASIIKRNITGRIGFPMKTENGWSDDDMEEFQALEHEEMLSKWTAYLVSLGSMNPKERELTNVLENIDEAEDFDMMNYSIDLIDKSISLFRQYFGSNPITFEQAMQQSVIDLFKLEEDYKCAEPIMRSIDLLLKRMKENVEATAE